MCVTNDRKLYVLESFWKNERMAATILARHLLKIYEIFDASLEILPEVKHTEVNLQVQGMEGSKSTTVSRAWTRDYMAGW